jgi:hypothetical protein
VSASTQHALHFLGAPKRLEVSQRWPLLVGLEERREGESYSRQRRLLVQKSGSERLLSWRRQAWPFLPSAWGSVGQLVFLPGEQ